MYGAIILNAAVKTFEPVLILRETIEPEWSRAPKRMAAHHRVVTCRLEQRLLVVRDYPCGSEVWIHSDSPGVVAKSSTLHPAKTDPDLKADLLDGLGDMQSGPLGSEQLAELVRRQTTSEGMASRMWTRASSRFTPCQWQQPRQPWVLRHAPA